MSDISKKIHSIDPEFPDTAPRKTGLNLSPLATESVPQSETRPDNDEDLLVPSFVTRRNSLSGDYYDDDASTGKGFLISGILFSLLWIGLGIGVLYARGTFDVSTWSIYETVLIGTLIVFPALMFIFLGVTVQKLRHMNSKADRLADISDRLLKADASAASEAETLAGTIRLQIRKLNTELSGANENIARLKDDTRQHLDVIGQSASETVSLSDVIISNFEAQEKTLSHLGDKTREQLSTLSETLNAEKESLEQTIEHVQTTFADTVRDLDVKLSALSETTNTIESRVQASIKSVDTLDARISETSSDLSEKINQMSEVSSKLSAENEMLDTHIIRHTADASKISALIERVDETLSYQISSAQKVEADLRETASEAKNQLSERLTSIQTELEKGQTLSQDALAMMEKGTTSIMTRFDAHVETIAQKLQNLDRTLRNIEGRAEQSADNGILGLDLPLQNPSLTTDKPTGRRLHLTPLDIEGGDIETDNTVRSYEAPTVSRSGLPSGETLSGGDANSLLFDQITGLMQPLELEDEVDLAMPLPDLPPASFAMDDRSAGDVIKPVTEASPLFGKSKTKSSKAKSKGGWRWRDMMGGFNSDDVNDEDSQPVPSFKDQLANMGIDPDATISDGTILDVANACVEKTVPIHTLVENRLSDVADHLRSIAKDNTAFAQAAAQHKANFAETINPDIMNSDAIRNALSTPDGRAYLLSLLT